MFGFASDLERTDVLYTSLLVQMWQGLGRRAGSRLEPEFLGLAAELAAGLRRRRGGPGPRRRAGGHVPGDRSRRPAPGHRRRWSSPTAPWSSAATSSRPTPVTRKSQVTYSGSGYSAGYTQGQRADIGTTRLRGSARALTG